MTKRRFVDDDDDGALVANGGSGGGTRAAVQAAVQAATAAAAAARGAAAAAAAASAPPPPPTTAAANAPTLEQSGAAISELPAGLASALRHAAKEGGNGGGGGASTSLLRQSLDALARGRRLALLVDVDACLLDAAAVSDLSREEEAAVDRCSRGEAAAGVPPEARSLQWQQSGSGGNVGVGGTPPPPPPPYWLKLRPGARRFLRQAAERFELWAAVGSPAASAALASIDPAGAIFGARVLPLPVPSAAAAASTGVLRALEDRAPAALALGDGATISALQAAAAGGGGGGGGDGAPALVPIERYAFFGATRRRERLPGGPVGLAEMGVDEDPERGALAGALRCLERAHGTLLERARRAVAGGDPDACASWDARRVLSDERRRVLGGCVLAFDPRVAARSHPLWRLAEQHGAACAEAPAAAALPAGLTHLVAAHGDTERASAARAAGAAVVSAAWVEHACLAWRLPAADRFAPPP